MKIKDVVVRVQQDDCPMDPRQYHHSKMVCFHSKYDLGDTHNYKKENYGSWDNLEFAIRKRERDVAIILPLYIYDHGDISISTTPFSCPWDSGQVGFVLLTKRKTKEMFGTEGPPIEQMKKFIEYEVREYNQYLTGDVWGYTLEKNGDEVDCCWGFYGHDYCVEQAKSAALAIAG